MFTAEIVRAEIEAVASIIGKAPSTVGEMTGQGGRFYARLCHGSRLWPETADKVMARLHEIKTSAVAVQCDISHGAARADIQGRIDQSGIGGAA